MNISTNRGRAVAGGAAIAALALLIAGCSAPVTPGTTGPTGPLPAAATCTPDQTSANTFALGTFLPLTGSLATLGPAATAGAGLALSEINAAGGVNGKAACIISTDSSDASHDADISQPSIDKLIQSKVSGILGAESSTVTENVLSSKVDPAGIVMFSPANTDDALSGASKWFFRDAVPNRSEGAALGDQITADGVKSLAILVFQDAYGLNLRDQTEAEFEANGGTVTYGAKGKNQEFAPTETNFTSIVQSALATKPDAVFVDTFDQTQAVLTALQSAGFDLSKTYFDDGNLGDYTNTAGFPDITGAKGTLQGNAPSDDWAKAATAWYTANEPGGSPIITWAYGPESYDAVTLMALAADVAGSNDPASIQANLLAVSGSTGGTACTTYADCLTLIQGGNKNIWYQGPSAIGPLNDKHDPSTGYVTIYQAKGQNMQDSIVTAIKSTVSE